VICDICNKEIKDFSIKMELEIETEKIILDKSKAISKNTVLDHENVCSSCFDKFQECFINMNTKEE